MEDSGEIASSQSTSFNELLFAELKLDSCQWEERPKAREAKKDLDCYDPQFLEIDALVKSM